MTQEDPRILDLRRLRELARQGGGDERIAAQHAKGKLTARERLNLLLDPGTFNELEPFITHQSDDEMGMATQTYMGEGVVTATARSKGAPSTSIAGLHGLRRHTERDAEPQNRRVMDLALRNGAPSSA
jgi:propionyl-CoA carboxylase beta chain